MDVDKEFI